MDEDEYVEVLGKRILRTEFEEDEQVVYLTLKQMLTFVTTITQIEQNRQVEVKEDSMVMRELNEFKRRIWAEIREKLGDIEE